MGPLDNDRTARLIRLLLELVTTGLMVWYMLPTGQRQLILMRVAQQCREATHWTAWKSGRFAIKRELAGDNDTADAGYGLAYEVMNGLYLRAEKWYNQLRGA